MIKRNKPKRKKVLKPRVDYIRCRVVHGCPRCKKDSIAELTVHSYCDDAKVECVYCGMRWDVDAPEVIDEVVYAINKLFQR